MILGPIDLVEAVAERLGDLRERVVFVGGAIVPLLLTHPSPRPPRPTEDVDIVVEATGHFGFHALEKELRRLGWVNDMNGPICRFLHGSLVLDAVPTDPDALGFSNVWSPEAVRSAEGRRLSNGLDVRIVSAPAFLALKWAAFDSADRMNGGDHVASRDFGDILTVLEGRPGIVDDIAAATPDLRDFLRARFRTLVERRDWPDLLAGNVDDGAEASLANLVRRIAEP